MNTLKQAARRVGTTAGTAEPALSEAVYRNRECRATPKLLGQVGDILCLLSLFSLNAAERAGFVALFQRRLSRAYEGGDKL